MNRATGRRGGAVAAARALLVGARDDLDEALAEVVGQEGVEDRVDGAVQVVEHERDWRYEQRTERHVGLRPRLPQHAGVVGRDARGERHHDGHEEPDDAAAGHQRVVGGSLAQALPGPPEHARRHLRRRRRRSGLPAGVRRPAVDLPRTVGPVGRTALVPRRGEAAAGTVPAVRTLAVSRPAQLDLQQRGGEYWCRRVGHGAVRVYI